MTAHLAPDLHSILAERKGTSVLLLKRSRLGKQNHSRAKTTDAKCQTSSLNPEVLTSTRMIAFVNRKSWWHVLPRDANAYRKRGKFLASSFKDAEFWGRPLDEPERVAIVRPLIGDEGKIECMLFGRKASHEDFSLDQRWRLDAKMRRAALSRGYDSIVLMSPSAFARWNSTGQLPRDLELNVLQP